MNSLLNRWCLKIVKELNTEGYITSLNIYLKADLLVSFLIFGNRLVGPDTNFSLISWQTARLLKHMGMNIQTSLSEALIHINKFGWIILNTT